VVSVLARVIIFAVPVALRFAPGNDSFERIA
jgi:hypothetical protein